MIYHPCLLAAGDEVAWETSRGIQRGKVLEIGGDHARVEYGPWLDTFWIPISRLYHW